MIEGPKIWISRSTIHKGDVDIRTGNIDVNGSLFISGSIKNGMSIKATENITVEGNIGTSTVSCGGNLTVNGGINSSEKFKIQCLGDLNANFIETSVIYVGGDMHVTKSILNSDVSLGGTLYMKDGDGMLAGGRICIWGGAKVRNIGFHSDASTEVIVGGSWQTEFKLDIKRKRIESLEAIREKDRLELRELTRRKDAQLTDKHKEMKQTYQDRLQKARTLMEKISEQIKQLERSPIFNKECAIEIPGVLTRSVRFYIKGKLANTGTHLRGVKVKATKENGEYITEL